MKFEEVLKAFREGKRIRRGSWHIYKHLSKSESSLIITTHDMDATDWQIIKNRTLADVKPGEEFSMPGFDGTYIMLRNGFFKSDKKYVYYYKLHFEIYGSDEELEVNP